MVNRSPEARPPRRRRRRRIRPASGRRPAPTAILAAPLFIALALALALTGPAFRAGVRHTVANPNFALPLLLVGILLFYFEFNRPGAVLPAAAGTLCVTLALFGLAHLPLNPIALLAIAAAFALLALEVLVNLHNIAATIATIALAFGLGRLVHNASGTLSQHLPVHPAVALVTAFIFIITTLILARVAQRARRNKRIQTVTTPSPAPYPAR